MIPRFHIVGRKNSGKTTLVVDLVQHLTQRGWRVGTIKHTHHHHELDVPGKDSHRHREAGASIVGIMAPSMNALYWPSTGDGDQGQRYAEMLRIFEPLCDLMLVEGHLSTSAPSFEVWRAGTHGVPLAVENNSIVAVITDDPVRVGVPVWSRKECGAIAERIEQVVRTSQL